MEDAPPSSRRARRARGAAAAPTPDAEPIVERDEAPDAREPIENDLPAAGVELEENELEGVALEGVALQDDDLEDDELASVLGLLGAEPVSAVPAAEPVPAMPRTARAGTASSLEARDTNGKSLKRDKNAPRRVALAWVDDDLVAAASPAVGTAPAPDLLARRPRRSPLRAGVLVPIATVLALAGAYAGTTLLWPLYAVAPTLDTAAVADITAPVSAPAWPAQGSAAVGVDGIGALSSATDPTAIASITKLVTALTVLDEMPLEPGEQGPSYSFTGRDRTTYWNFLARDESALDVPVGGSLTQYQLLQGMLIGSAGNYADFLASTIWPSDAVFAQAATTWLQRHGVSGITITEPTGIDPANAADPAALLVLAEKALANPVIAEIVRTASVDLPGAGHVENTNDLLADPSIVGVKTGGLWDYYNLLAAKDVTVGETTVRLYASVLGQPTDELRDGETARLLDALAAEVSAPSVLPAGTIAGVVSTRWGATANVVTDADASAVLWNGAAAQSAVSLRLGDARSAGQDVGSLTLTGPLGTATVAVELASDIEPPDAWWRLTHPLELFGLVG